VCNILFQLDKCTENYSTYKNPGLSLGDVLEIFLEQKSIFSHRMNIGYPRGQK